MENEDTTLILVSLMESIFLTYSYSGKGHPLGYGPLIIRIDEFFLDELLPGQKGFMI